MKKIIIASIVFLLSALSSIMLFCYFNNETADMESQELISEQFAEQYMIEIQQQYTNNEQDSTTPTLSDSDFDYNDNEIYSYFDESYAYGYVDCVLEIPAIDLRQSVFSGDADQIEHDLSRWLPVTSRTDYVLGDTHYCIYMHNPRNKSIKISNAQEQLNIGDYIVVTQKNTVYLYSVTGVFSEWRNKCTEKYVNNETLGPEYIYIFTCARGEWQGKNLVIEGKLFKTYLLSDWMEHKDYYISEYKSIPIEDNIKKELYLTITNNENYLVATVEDDSLNTVNCSIGIFNEDGYLLNDEYCIKYSGGELILPPLESGNYYVGIYECEDEYYSNTSYLININKQNITIHTNQQLNNSENQSIILLKHITILFNIISLIFLVVIIYKHLISPKQK